MLKLNFLKSKLAKDSLIYTFTDVLNMGIPFLLLPILAKYLTPSDYGILTAFTSIIAGVSIFVSLQVESAVNVNYYKFTKKQLSIFIYNVLIISFISLCTITLLSLFFIDYLEEKFSITYSWIFLALLVSFCNILTTINTNLWVMEKKPIPFAIFKILNTIVNLTTSLILVVSFLMSWEGRAKGILVAAFSFSVISFFILLNRKYITFEFNYKYIKEALNFGIPLIPYQLSGWIRNGGIVFLLIFLVGKNETGLFSVGAKFASIIYVLSMAFSKAWAPYIYSELSSENFNEERKRKIVKITYLSFLVFFGLALFFTFIAPFLIDYIFPTVYSNSYNYVGYLVFGAAFQAMFIMVVQYLYFEKKTKYVAYITFTVALINITLAYFLIKLNGAIGAAQANMISFLISFIAIWYYSNKVYKMPWNIFKSIK